MMHRAMIYVLKSEICPHLIKIIAICTTCILVEPDGITCYKYLTKCLVLGEFSTNEKPNSLESWKVGKYILKKTPEVLNICNQNINLSMNQRTYLPTISSSL